MAESAMNKTTVAQQAKTASFLSPAQGMLQRQCACGNHTVAGGECAACAQKKSGLQRKLSIGASNDPLEREADRVADQVLAAPAHSAVSGAPLRIQRFSGQSNQQMDPAPASVDRALVSSGRPLDPTLRKDMEQRFGHDFSQVRVHSGTAAEQSARDVSANAYTVGHDLVFGTGRFAPGTSEGRRLIAHELTHVLQQSGGGGTGSEAANGPAFPSSVSARGTAAVMVTQSSRLGVARDPSEEDDDEQLKRHRGEPYDPRKKAADLEEAFGKGSVSSSTLPPANKSNVSRANRKPVPGVGFDQRGFPIFDNVAAFDTRIDSPTATTRDRDVHFNAATAKLREAVNKDERLADRFTPAALADIKAGKGKIRGFTWEHHQEFGRMQLVPEEIHAATGHVGGYHMRSWPTVSNKAPFKPASTVKKLASGAAIIAGVLSAEGKATAANEVGITSVAPNQPTSGASAVAPEKGTTQTPPPTSAKPSVKLPVPTATPFGRREDGLPDTPGSKPTSANTGSLAERAGPKQKLAIRVPSQPLPKAIDERKGEAIGGGVMLALEGLHALLNYFADKKQRAAAEEGWAREWPRIQEEITRSGKGVVVYFEYTRYGDSSILVYEGIQWSSGGNDPGQPASIRGAGQAASFSRAYVGPTQEQASITDETALEFRRTELRHTQRVYQESAERMSKEGWVGRKLRERVGSHLDPKLAYDAKAHLVSAGEAIKQKRFSDATRSLDLAEKALAEMTEQFQGYMGPGKLD
jgi:hypothetical protein